MFTYQFWQVAIERAVKTFAQSLLAIFSAIGVGLLTVSWIAALSTAGIAAVLSVLTSMASAPVGRPNSPSPLPVGPRLHLRRPGPRSRRPSQPSQVVTRLAREGSHRGRTCRPEPAFPRKGARPQVVGQVPRGLLKQVGDLRGSGCGGGPERGRGRLSLIAGVHAATHVASPRRVSDEASTTRMGTARRGLAEGGLNDRRTASIHTRSLGDAGHRSSRPPTGF